MPHDTSPPRTGLILKGAVLSIVTLLSVHAGLVTYFDHYAQAEEHRKFGEAKPEALINLRAYEKDQLSGGRVPIDKAMQDMLARGRTASPDITPSESKDIAPLAGWPKLPSEVPAAMTAPPSTAAPSASAPAVDAGAAAVPPVNGPVPKGRPDRAHPDRGTTPSKPLPKNP